MGNRPLPILPPELRNPYYFKCADICGHIQSFLHGEADRGEVVVITPALLNSHALRDTFRLKLTDLGKKKDKPHGVFKDAAAVQWSNSDTSFVSTVAVGTKHTCVFLRHTMDAERNRQYMVFTTKETQVIPTHSPIHSRTHPRTHALTHTQMNVVLPNRSVKKSECAQLQRHLVVDDEVNLEVVHLDRAQDTVLPIVRVPQGLTLSQVRRDAVVIVQVNGVLAFRDVVTGRWVPRPHATTFLMSLQRVCGIAIYSDQKVSDFTRCGVLSMFGLSFLSNPDTILKFLDEYGLGAENACAVIASGVEQEFNDVSVVKVRPYTKSSVRDNLLFPHGELVTMLMNAMQSSNTSIHIRGDLVDE